MADLTVLQRIQVELGKLSALRNARYTLVIGERYIAVQSNTQLIDTIEATQLQPLLDWLVKEQALALVVH